MCRTTVGPLEPTMGIEPMTSILPRLCATAALRGQTENTALCHIADDDRAVHARLRLVSPAHRHTRAKRLRDRRHHSSPLDRREPIEHTTSIPSRRNHYHTHDCANRHAANRRLTIITRGLLPPAVMIPRTLITNSAGYPRYLRTTVVAPLAQAQVARASENPPTQAGGSVKVRPNCRRVTQRATCVSSGRGGR